MLIEFLILTAVAAVLLYRWATKNYDHFEKRNMPHDKPTFLLGSGKDIILRRKNMVEATCDFYNKHDGLVYGAFDNTEPIILIRDPLLIKHITIKDFDHFVNRRRFLDESNQSILNHTLVAMQNGKWRDMRSTLSPAFTGSKMRQMFELILQTVNEAMTYLKEVEEQQQQQQTADVNNSLEGFEIDIKDFTSRLTNDIIASTAFGLKINSFRDKDNEFYVRARKAINFSPLQLFKMMFMMMLPKLAQLLKLDLFDKNYMNYFLRLVLDAMKYRQENNIHRPDMINLLMEARGMIPTEITKTHYREWSDVEMVAQCFIFFVAGFEPSSSFMSFAAHELMEYPEVQQKLYEEIQDVNEQLQGKPITFEVLQKMRYMDMVVSEVLRKWPVALVIERVCNKDFIYESPEGERIEFKKDDKIRIPMVALHRDPKYYKNPQVLDPERFNEENKSNIDGGCYFPFGLGPRNCIGNRFALLEGKAFLYYLIRDYRLEASPKSTVPLELDRKTFQLKPKNGFWLQLKQRN